MTAKYFSVLLVAKRLCITERAVRKNCVQGRYKGAVKRGGSWMIPADADIRLQDAREPMGSPILPQELLGVPVKKIEELKRKLGILEQFDTYAAEHVRRGGYYSDAAVKFARLKKIGESTLRRWIKKRRESGELGLIDSRGGKILGHETISEEAFEHFKSLYLHPAQPGIKQSWKMLRCMNTDEDRGWTIPSYRVMCRYVDENIQYAAKVLHREGKGSYDAKCAPYIQTDPDSIEAGECWVGDHHQFNCLIRNRGKWARPWITAWEDRRSRMIVGWWVSLSPNQGTILEAMRLGIKKHGPPKSVKIDNGRDYDSEMWTGTTKAKRRKSRVLKAGYIDEEMISGLYAMMKIKVSFALPYHPQSKPVERFFDTIDGQLVKFIPTYCGKDTKRKPEHLNKYLQSEKAIGEAHELKGFCELVGQYIEAYNNHPHTGVGMDGQTPAEVMELRSSRGVMRDGVAELLLRGWTGKIKVGKNGVTVKGCTYGQFNPVLSNWCGKEVFVSYDPDDMLEVFVYDPATTKLITIAKENELYCYGDRVVNEDAMKTAQKQKAKALRTMRDVPNASLIRNSSRVVLAIKAMEDNGREAPKERPDEKSIRVVSTPLDDQVREHEIRKKQEEVKKIVEGEKPREKIVFNFDKLRPPKRKPNKLLGGLFGA